MSNRLSYDVMNENGKWGNILDIPSWYAKELSDEIGLEYSKRVIVDEKTLGTHLIAAQNLLKENENFLKENEASKKVWQEMLSKAQTEVAADKAMEMMNEYDHMILDTKEFVDAYQKIVVALAILEQSYDLTISYYYG